MTQKQPNRHVFLTARPGHFVRGCLARLMCDDTESQSFEVYVVPYLEANAWVDEDDREQEVKDFESILRGMNAGLEIKHTLTRMELGFTTTEDLVKWVLDQEGAEPFCLHVPSIHCGLPAVRQLAHAATRIIAARDNLFYSLYDPLCLTPPLMRLPREVSKFKRSFLGSGYDDRNIAEYETFGVSDTVHARSVNNVIFYMKSQSDGALIAAAVKLEELFADPDRPHSDVEARALLPLGAGMTVYSEGPLPAKSA
jgi:hypothetical protein